MIVICLTFVIFIIFIGVYLVRRRLVMIGPQNGSSNDLVSVMAVMGSGGHTQEMITLLSYLNVGSVDGNVKKYSPITFVASKDDLLSQNKVKQLTQTLSDFELFLITRSRSVGQSYWTSIWTTITALIESFSIIYKVRPKLLVCNGPGVCVPLCLAAKLLFKSQVCIVFVESFCRIESLSLSGKILYFGRICDHFLVQWPQLTHRYNRAKYLGLLV